MTVLSSDVPAPQRSRPGARRPAHIRERGYLAALVGLIAAGLAYRWPLLQTGFLLDDYIQLDMLRGQYPLPRHAFDLFSFTRGASENIVLRATGFLPWWSHPDLKLALFRPLSSLLTWLDFTLFDGNALAYHLHTLAWWIGLFVVWARVLRRFLPPGAVLLSVSLVIAHPAHTMLLGWLASRNALVGTVLALLGFECQLRADRTGSRVALAAAWSGYILAICASEYAFAVLPYPALYACTRHRAGTRAFWLNVATWAAFVGGWIAIRVAFDYGSHDSGMYIDPLTEPAAFLQTAGVRLTMLLSDAVLALRCTWPIYGMPWPGWLERVGISPASWPHIQVLLGVVAIAIAVALALRVAVGPDASSARPLRFVSIALPFTVLPLLATLPDSRMVLPLLLGWSALLAHWLLTCARQLRARPRESRNWFRFAAPLALWLAGCVAPVLYGADEIRRIPNLAEVVRAAILDSQLDDVIRDKPVYLIAAAEPTTFLLPLARIWYRRPVPVTFQVLSEVPSAQELSRIDDRTFALEATHIRAPGLHLPDAFNRAGLQPGQRVSTPGMRVTVERTLDGHALRTRFEMDRDLEECVLLAQTRTGLQRVSFPAVGNTLTISEPIYSVDFKTSRR